MNKKKGAYAGGSSTHPKYDFSGLDSAKLLNSNELANQNGNNSSGNEDYQSEILRELQTSEGGFAFDDHFISLSKVWPEIRYLLQIKESGCGTLPISDICAVVAKAKNGKTHLVVVFCASILGYVGFGINSLIDNAKIIYFDTEQARINTVKVIRKIHTLLGWDLSKDNDRLMAFNLRAMDIRERYPYIQKVVERLKPTLAVIDGVADLVADFNNVAESREMANKLKKLSTENDLCVLCVIHENPSETKSNLRGNLGREIQNAASDLWRVEKNRFVFNVKHIFNRNSAEGETFAFQIDGHGTPYPATPIQEVKQEQKQKQDEEDLSRLIADAYGSETKFKYSELRKRIMEKCKKSEATVNRYINSAKDNGLLKHEGVYYLKI